MGRERPPAGGIGLHRLLNARAPPAEDGRGWAATYLYATPTGTDAYQSPFSKESSENWTPADTRRAKPAPHLRFTNRPNWQKFDYDWLGNLSESDDNEHGFYDRSLGTQSHGNANKPYQLSAANNSTQASGSGFAGNVTTLYDAMGNLTRLSVSRATNTTTCLSDGSGCNQYYAYDWDEVGRLVRARRWDSTSAAPAASTTVPTPTAAIDLRYRYDASDQRVIKRTYNATAANQRHTLYLFGSLEVHRTLYASNAYTVDTASLVPYAMANGVRLARLRYDAAATVPQVAGLPTAQGGSNTGATLHVLLELGDHLGSTGTVLDKVSSELVEKTGYLPFGARESDYRPSRWNGFREDYGFTGKEEDVEVGLTYFGKRFLSPQLGRWVSADPLAVHAPGRADLNLYAYVSGAVLKSVDPVELDREYAEGRTTMREYASRLPQGGTGDAMRAGIGGILNVVAQRAAYVHEHRMEDRGASWGSYDSSTKSLYMETNIWHHSRDTRVGEVTMAGALQGRRTMIHESFHAYEDLVLKDDLGYKALTDASRDNYYKKFTPSVEDAGRAREEAFAEYVGKRGNAYLNAQDELTRLTGQHSLTQSEYNRISRTFENAIKVANEGSVGYYEGIKKDGKSGQVPVDAAIDPNAKPWLDQLSGISDKFESNQGIAHFKESIVTQESERR